MLSSNSIWQDAKNEFRKGNMISRLIMVNVGVFLAVNIIRVLLWMISTDAKADFFALIDWLAIPIEPIEILKKPWTIVTHMFLHYEFGHVLWNMLYLFWFGKILRTYVGDKKLLPIYFYGGLCGALVAVSAYNLIPVFQEYDPALVMLGASAGVTAIMVAAGTIAPDHTIFLIFVGPVKIKYLVLVIVLLDIFFLPYMINTGGTIAHLGGALLGYVFIKKLQQGNDWSIRFNKAFDRLAVFFAKRPSPKVAYKNATGTKKQQASKKQSASPMSDSKQQKIDAILDKIARSGYDSLSKEEKEFLFKVSNED
jgi:membrane associated rhomboid family serine protease